MKVNDVVYYTDVDNDNSSGVYTITIVDGEIITLDNGFSEIQAYRNELQPFKRGIKEIVEILKLLKRGF